MSYLKKEYVLASSVSPSPIKRRKKLNRKKKKEFFTFKKSNTISFPPFQAILKPKPFVAVAFQWAESQAGLRSGSHRPRTGSLASRLQGQQLPLSPLGGLLGSQTNWYCWQPAYHPILQLSISWWCFATCWFSGERLCSALPSPSKMNTPFPNSLGFRKSGARYRHGHLLRGK